MRPFAALTTLALAGLVAGPACAESKVLHQERSVYRNILVVQDGDERCLSFRARRYVGRQSCKLLSQPDRLVFEYTRMMLAGLYLSPSPRRILIIGLGGGTLPDALQELVPGAQIDVVELDPAVQRAATRFFDYRPRPGARVVVSDGRVFVKRQARAGAGGRYDMVFLDAFEEDYIPEHMLTREFLEELKAIMNPGAVIVANTFSSSGLYDYESVTYRTVFGPFFNMRQGNRVIVGRLGGLPSPDQVRRNAAAWEARFRARGASSSELLSMMSLAQDWNPRARILTDQYSPSNLLNASRRGRKG